MATALREPLSPDVIAGQHPHPSRGLTPFFTSMDRVPISMCVSRRRRGRVPPHAATQLCRRTACGPAEISTACRRAGQSVCEGPGGVLGGEPVANFR